MKKQLLAIILALLLVLTTACSMAKENNTQATGGIAEDGSAYSQNQDKSKTANQADDKDFQRKIIKNGTLEMEAENVEKTYADIIAFAQKNGGYEFNHERTTRSDFITITAVIKIAPDKLDALMNYAGSAATIINSSTSSEDVTSDYYDAEVRLKTLKTSLDQYYKFLNETKSTDEILKIQNEINSLTEEIEALEGKIKLWDSLSEECTLNISISQINDPLKPQKDIQWNALTWSDMGTLIKNGFVGVSSVLVGALQWILIILVSASPILIIGIVIWLCVRRNRKRKKQQSINNTDQK